MSVIPTPLKKDSHIYHNITAAVLCDKGLFTVKRQEIEHAVDNFASTIPRIAGSEPWRPQPSETDVDLVIIHAMVNVAYIYLRKDCTGIIDATSERCLAAAHAVSTAVRQLKEEDYDYLDPIISVRGSPTILPSIIADSYGIGMLEGGRGTIHLSPL